MKRALLAALVAVAAAGAGFAAVRMQAWTNPFGAPYRGRSHLALGGPFTLVGPGGRPVRSTDFRGHWLLVYFGYTNCPDACPTALNDIGLALDAMRGRGSRIVPLFITVDPSRDTPSVLAAYTRQFFPAMIGLTGSPADIRRTERTWRVYAARHPIKGGYTMDHSNIIYVVDQAGRVAGLIDGAAGPKEIEVQVEALQDATPVGGAT